MTEMTLHEVVNADASTIRAWLDATATPPTAAELVVAAYRAPSPEVRALLVHQAQIDVAGWESCRLNAAHAAALVGHTGPLVETATHEVEIDGLVELESGPPVGGWAALHIAAALGHVEVVEALLDRGAAIDDGVRISALAATYTALDLAVTNHREEVVARLLARGAKPGPRTLTCLSASTPEGVIVRLSESGLDFNDWVPGNPLTGTVARPSFHVSPGGRGALLTAADRVGYLQRLFAAGLRLDGPRLLELLEDLRDPDAAEALIDCALGHDLDLDAKDRAALFELAMRTLPLAAVQRLVLGGVGPAAVRVKKSWPEAKAKLAWLEAAASAPPPLRFTDFATLSDDLLTAETIAAAFLDGALLGVGIGTPFADAASAVGEALDELGAELRSESESYETRAWHRIWLGVDAEAISQIDYEAKFGEPARAKATRAALEAAFTKGFGKPKGRSKRVWTTERADITVRSREDFDQGDIHCVIVEMAPPREPAPSPAKKPRRPKVDPKALAATIEAYVNDVSGDCFDVGLTAQGASVEVRRGRIDIAVDVAFTSHHGDDVEESATLTWKDAPLDGDTLHPDLGAAVIEAIGAVVSEANEG